MGNGCIQQMMIETEGSIQKNNIHHTIIRKQGMNKEKDFVYHVTAVRSTLSMMFGWMYSYENKSHKT